MADYSKWERLIREEDDKEKMEKLMKKAQTRAKYEQEQAQKKKEWLEKHPEEKGHVHHGCGCGYADPEAIKRAQEQRKNALPLEEKNKKKIIAIRATREHGKQLFKEGKLEQAYAVYDRGVLIINGCYGMTSEEMDEIAEHEHALTLNMALLKLKLKDPARAIDHCQMALSLDKAHPNNVKAWFRMAQAHEAMGNLDKAQDALNKAKELSPDDVSVRRLQKTLRQKKKEERKAVQSFHAKMANKLQQQEL